MEDIEQLDLQRIVVKLHNIGSVEENVAAWKHALCLVVAKLTDSQRSTSERPVLLEFIKHCITKAPQMFVHSPHFLVGDAEGNVNNNLTTENEEKTCCDLTQWVSSRLIYMLTILENDEALINVTTDILVVLLQTVAIKDCKSFSKLSAEYICALSDMSCLVEELEDKEENAWKGKELKRFISYKDGNSDGNGEAKLNYKPVMLSSPIICEKLQVVLTEIITKMALNVSLYAYVKSNCGMVTSLWTTTAMQLQWGEVRLKTVSLNLANKLLLHRALPCGETLDYFLACVVALLDILCAGYDDCEGDYIQLERSVIDILLQFIASYRSPSVPEFVTQIVVNKLAKGIANGLIKNGSLCLRSPHTRRSLYNILVQVCFSDEVDMLSGQLSEEEISALNNKIMGEFGRTNNSKYAIKWLRSSVIYDVKNEERNSAESSSTSTLDCDIGLADLAATSDVEEEAGKNKNSAAPSENGSLSASLVKSPTVVLVNQKLLQLQKCVRESSPEEIDYECCFEGISTALEVLVWSSVKILSQEADGNLCEILNEANVLALMSMWKQFISVASLNKYDKVSAYYTKIVDGISCILFGNDVLKISLETFQTITWILSMHWLPAEMSWMDLRPGDKKEVTKICNHLADKLDVQLLAKCVLALAFIPKEVASKWRTHVIKVALNDTVDEIKSASVRCFPFFLYHMGPNANHLVYDVLHSLVKSKSTSVQVSLAEILGPLVCVVSRKAMLNRNLKTEVNELVINSIEVKCVFCDQWHVDDDTANAKDRPKTVDPMMFLPFVELIQPTTISGVKMHMVESLDRLFAHINVRSSSSADSPSVQLVSQCMCLLNDPDNLIRQGYNKPLKRLLSEGGHEAVSPAEQLIITRMRKVLFSAQEVKNNFLVESILRTTGYLARHAEDSFLVLLVIALLDSICKPLCPLVGSVAHNQLQLLAKAKQIQLNHLFLQFSKKFCEVVVKNMYDAEAMKDDMEPLDIVKEVVDAFEFENITQFFKKTEPALLPHLIKKGDAIASQLIKMVAKQVGDPNHKGPVYRNIGHIYCHIVCSTEPDEFRKLCHYLENIFDKPLVEFLSAGSNIEFDLLLRLASHKKQVLLGFKFYYSKLNVSITEEVSTDEGIAKVLQPKLLGMLVHLDNYLNNGTVEIQEKRKAYESMITLMELMGPNRITAVRIRMMTTLKIGLKFKDQGFPELCCKAWNCFVRSIEINTIGSMLSQIIVLLLPLLNILPKQVADIFNFLIVDNRKTLHNHFHDLYFIPDIPDLKDVNSVLKYYTEGRYSVKDVKVQIDSLLKGIDHESEEVRQYALTKLKTLLHNNKAALHSCILGSENVFPLISRIVHALLNGCRDSSPNLRPLYGACLGELGAVDPARLQISTNKSSASLQSFQSSVNDPNFGSDLMFKLSQAYLRAEDRSYQDSVAFAIQSLIQIYDITDDPEANSSGYKMWKKFSEEVQEVISPLINSRYILKGNYEWANLHKPIYRGGRKGHTFDSWVCTLTSYLGSQIEESTARAIYAACRGVLRFNSQIALHMLPYAVVHVLLENDEEHILMITNEVLAVLNHAKDPDTRNGLSSDLSHMCAQTVFSVLDHLIKWLRHRVMTLSTIAANHAAKLRVHHSSVDSNYKTDDHYLQTTDFLDKIPKDTLAYASFNCGAYTRSLMHYEKFITSKKEDLHMEQHLDFMQKLYVALDEPDGVAGITAIKQTQPTLNEQILAYESVGQLSDALVCYDRAVKLEPDSLILRKGLLRCRLDLGELNSGMEQVNGIIAERPEWTEQLNEFRLEAAWKLGHWEKLQYFQKSESKTRNWNACLGKIFLAARAGDQLEFNKQIQMSRNELMGPLCAASMEFGSYQRGYKYIIHLHMLNELEQGLRILLDLQSETEMEVSSACTQSLPLNQLLQEWELRLKILQPSFRVQEPILNLRRTILNLAKERNNTSILDQAIGHSWLQTVRIARECGLVQAAHSSLLNAKSYNVPEVCIENAKWLWNRGDYDMAQGCLEKAVEEYYPDRSKFMAGHGIPEQRFACAQVLLLLGKYREQTASLESFTMMSHFKDVTKIYGEWEDAYFTCAMYYDKIMNNLIAERPDSRVGDFFLQVLNNLGLSLQYGSQYIYQSMPRLLTLWLDYGADLMEPEKYGRSEAIRQTKEAVLNRLNKKIGEFTERLPAYQFFTAFPQLISRICHTHPQVFCQLRDIIANLLVVYPQQAMWSMMAVSKSSFQVRSKRCQEIFNHAKSTKPDLNKFLHDAQKLTERLLDLCNRNAENSVNTLSISQHFKPLLRLVDEKNFSQILIPLQSLITVSLPGTGIKNIEEHSPFPIEHVYIRGLEDAVELLPSLQRPKKVSLRGSDGKNYVMLCKPKDDLRKDARLMEFNSVVNKCLRKDPEARRRDLKIRTFAVTPLNEECGMLEWVPNTAGFRYILNKLYRERGIYTSGKELKSMQLPPNATLDRKLDVFQNKLLPRHPALFSEWLLKTFPDPISWYNARLAYCRTAAVMSLVGYILGLGDRHGENILLDSTTGDCVHVDFNCLFNKGETFDYPEIVPFRLTHNMVEAMGPMRSEGIFRRACEVCMRVMRDESDPLMSVLKSFIYDPLVEWSKPSKGRTNPTASGEIKNEQAQTHVSNIESRLKGILKTKSKVKGLPLSVEGHVKHLIKEATDENKLCQMYIGWAAYM